jgi:hypothetical protein
MSGSGESRPNVRRTANITRKTTHVICFLLIATFSYGAWDSWATLQLKSRGIQTTATVVQKLDRWRQRLFSSTPITSAKVAYKDEQTKREVEVELPREIGRHLEVGQRFQVFYDKSHPLRVLHPWRSVIVEQFWRAIAGIFVFGCVWALITILTSNRTTGSLAGS